MTDRSGIFAGEDPFDIARTWLDEAKAVEPNDPDAIALATSVFGTDPANVVGVHVRLGDAVDTSGVRSALLRSRQGFSARSSGSVRTTCAPCVNLHAAPRLQMPFW